MFTWLKVLRELSRQEDLMHENEMRIQRLEKLNADFEFLKQGMAECSAQLDVLFRKKEAFHKEIEEDSRNISVYLEKMELSGQVATAKVEEIRMEAERYTEKVSAVLKGFETELNGFSGQVADLKNAVTDLLR